MGAFAPAKINLTLAVGPPRADGRHPLDSLVVFADVGDRVRLDLVSEGEGGAAFEGPFAAGLEALPPESLSWTAPCAALLEAAGVRAGLRWRLDKRLPLASGIGGGSADAAAALRLLNARLGLGWSLERLAAFAAPFGGDLPACVLSRPCRMRDDGARITPLEAPLRFDAVLVNPNVPCPTGPVYRAFDAMGLGHGFREREPPPPGDWFDWIAASANDLEAPARALVPEIGAVLAALEADPAVRLARLSGSGATAFALCADDAAARAVADRLAAARPDWWVVATTLGAPPPG